MTQMKRRLSSIAPRRCTAHYTMLRFRSDISNFTLQIFVGGGNPKHASVANRLKRCTEFSSARRGPECKISDIRLDISAETAHPKAISRRIQSSMSTLRLVALCLAASALVSAQQGRGTIL